MMKVLQALLGNVDAQLAVAYEYGYGPPARRNLQRAIYWARRAMKSGAADADLLLVSLLVAADAPEEATREMIALYERAAASGDVVAQFNLGRCHENGDGVPRDLKKALYWYTMAAAQRNTEAEQAVARLCREAPTN